MIDILERAKLFDALSKLKATDKPEFGIMTPQHMVEHLAFAVRFSNGKAPQEHHYPIEKQQRIKAFVIYSDADLPIDFKSPVLPINRLPALELSGLSQAIDKLKSELNDFDDYFLAYPSNKPINPTMGELNGKEWIRFHDRHFRHHLKQFGLI